MMDYINNMNITLSNAKIIELKWQFQWNLF
jgi:hypothetical protein